MRSKILTFACLFLSVCHGFSQLSVKNNTAILVKDEVLFVKGAIHLTTNSNIYLREEAQLVQGDGVTGNSGLGTLSVYQEGTVNQWAYNYWCSPVGNINTDMSINNPFFANQIDDPLLGTSDITDSSNALFTNSYNGIATPLTISKRWIYTFADANSSGSTSWNYVAENNPITPGLGFTMKGIGTAETGNQAYDFRGKPNNGDMFNTVLENQYTLVGNPYPSALDALEFIHDTHNSASINGTLYFWEQKSTGSHVLAAYEGGYATYTISADGSIESFTKALFSKYNSNGDIVDPGSASDTSKKVSRYIPIGQGFMVEGVANSTVKTSNAHRTYYKESWTESEFFRTDSSTTPSTASSQTQESYTSVPNDYSRFRVYVTFNDLYVRELLLNFHSNATTDFDYGLESMSASDVANDASWSVYYGDYVTQALPYSDDLMIPLKLKAQGDLALEFTIGDLQNFDDNQEIFLFDQELNTYTNLRSSNYTITIPSGVYTDRFNIVFTQGATLDLDENTSESVSVYSQASPSQLVVNNPKLLKLTNLKLYDITGKLIFETPFETIESTYVISTKQLASAVYVAALWSDDNTIFSTKVIISN